MSANVGYATLTVIPSAKGFSKALSGDVNPGMTKAGKEGGAALGGGLVATAGKFAAPLAGIFAVSAAKDFFSDAIAGASDLNEAGTKLEAIFGPAAAAVQDFAGKGAKALGQTRLEVLNSAASFGTFGKAAGLAGPELAGFSTELAQLSTDLASFYNTDPSQAAEAISAGLRGEAEPLRQYGVLLDDATLRSEALSQGLIKTTKDALTPQQKVLAAHAVIMKQTKDAQGDFAKTSGGLANQQRILTAQFEDFKSTLGTALLPVATGVVSFLNSSFGPALEKVGPAVQGLTDIIVKGDFTGAFRDAFGLEEDSNVVGYIFQVRDAVTGLYDFIFKGDYTGALGRAFGLSEDDAIVGQLFDLRDGAIDVFNTVKDGWATLIGAFTGAGGGTGDIPFLNEVIDIGASARNVFDQLIEGVQRLLPVVMGIAAGLWANLQPLLPRITAIFQGILQVVGGVLAVLGQAISTAVTVIVWVWQNFGDTILGFVKTVWSAIIGVIEPAIQLILAVIRTVMAVLKGDWAGAWQGIKDTVSAAWSLIASIVTGALSIVWGAIKGAFTIIVGLINSAMGNVLSRVTGAMSGFVSAIANGVSAALRWLQALPGRILGALASLGSLLVNVGIGLLRGFVNGQIRGWSLVGSFLASIPGKIVSGIGSLGSTLLSAGGDLIGGFIRGIQNRAGALIGVIRSSITDKLPSFVKDALGIHSPSRVFMELGAFTAQGMALGIAGGAKDVQKAADGLVPAAPAFSSPDVSSAASGAGAGGLGALIGSLTIAGSGDVKSDIEELAFALRTITRGGVYARA